MAITFEKGFARLFIVIAILLGVFALIYSLGNGGTLWGAILAGVIAFGIVVLIWLIMRWIVRGFREGSPQQTNEVSQETAPIHERAFGFLQCAIYVQKRIERIQSIYSTESKPSADWCYRLRGEIDCLKELISYLKAETSMLNDETIGDAMRFDDISKDFEIRYKSIHIFLAERLNTLAPEKKDI